MNCVAVTRMKNEVDIAEAFVRHHSTIFKRLIVIDDFSSDGTYELMQKLVAEGLPVDLHRETQVGHAQSSTTTRFMHVAFDDLGADWVAPLDADEFLELPPAASLETILPKDGTYPVEMRWDNFVWSTPNAGDVPGNPVIALNLRMPTRRWHYKVIIPRSIGARLECEVTEGNHAVKLGDTICATTYIDGVRLCHFPIRSVEQYSYKIAFGYMRYCRGTDEQSGFHYRKPFHLLKIDMPAFIAAMEMASRDYSLCPGETNEGNPTLSPLRYCGGPLKYRSKAGSAIAAISTLLEDVFNQLDKTKREGKILETLLATNSGQSEHVGEQAAPEATTAGLSALLRKSMVESAALRAELAAAKQMLAEQSCRLNSLGFLARSLAGLGKSKLRERFSKRIYKAN